MNISPPRRTLGALAALSILVLGGRGTPGQDPGLPEPFTGRLVDSSGNPLPEGSELEGRVLFYVVDPDQEHLIISLGVEPDLETVRIGQDGRFQIRPKRHTLPNHRAWLLLRRSTEDETRHRVLSPARPGDQGTLTLEPERLLASGEFVDDAGLPQPAHGVGRHIIGAGEPGGPSAEKRLGARWVTDGSHYELWGWPAAGDWAVRPRYVYHGPDGELTRLGPWGSKTNLILPAAGWIQPQLLLPAPFPRSGVHAVMRDLERGTTRRQFLLTHPTSDRPVTTNVRLSLGRHHVTLEIHGEQVHDYGTIDVPHGDTTKLPVSDLRGKVAVHRIEVVDPNGRPIPAARVWVIGSPDEPRARDTFGSRASAGAPPKRESVILIATTRESVDLEVFEFGYRSGACRVENVAEDRVVVLPPNGR